MGAGLGVTTGAGLGVTTGAGLGATALTGAGLGVTTGAGVGLGATALIGAGLKSSGASISALVLLRLGATGAGLGVTTGAGAGARYGIGVVTLGRTNAGSRFSITFWDNGLLWLCTTGAGLGLGAGAGTLPIPDWYCAIRLCNSAGLIPNPPNPMFPNPIFIALPN